MKLKKILLSLILSPLIMIQAQASTPVRLDLVDTAIQAGGFKTLVSLVQKAGLVETLKGPGPFTVFAPTDAAFAKLPKALVDKLLADPKLLITVLTYHVLAGQVLAKTAVELASQSCEGTKVVTVAGQQLNLSLRGKDQGLFINDSKVTTADILTSNGVIHVIDSVLIPQL